MSSDRPDYVPAMWTQGGVNRAFQRDPRRVLLWLVIAPVVAALLAIGLIAGGNSLGYFLAFIALLLIAQGIVYAPRAYRASRDTESQ